MSEFKSTGWFKVGEIIPANAIFLARETRRENIQYHHVHDMLPDDETWDNVEYLLYEFPVGTACVEKHPPKECEVPK